MVVLAGTTTMFPGTPAPQVVALPSTLLQPLTTSGTSCAMPKITAHPTNPTDALVRRMVMAERFRDAQPAINQPAQDTIVRDSSGDTE